MNNTKNSTWIYGGLQQVGVGVRKNDDAWDFYRKKLGFDVLMFDEDGTADIMSPYMGNKSWKRHARFAINLRGGGGMEIWQYSDRTPVAMEGEVQLGSLGIIAPHIRCQNIERVRDEMLSCELEISKIYYGPDHQARFYMKDNEYNWLCITESNKGWFIPQKNPHKKSGKIAYKGGVSGAIIGVSDMDKSVSFYQRICGYDEVVCDENKRFEDFDIFLGQQQVRRVILRRSDALQEKQRGLFAHLLSESQIELIEAKENRKDHIFKNRYWGDLGFIHICFDIRGMDALRSHCEKEGYPFTIDTGSDADFAMDDASGRFAYLEDPDSTLIEFVEVYKMPILKKLGISLDMKKKKFGLVLSKFLLRQLKFMRQK